MSSLILIAHNLRSTHNVGSLLRTADGLGIDQVWLTGYSPYPLQKEDARLPHLANKINAQIAKTALGAEKNFGIHRDDIEVVISKLREEGYEIAALEQSLNSIPLSGYQPPDKLALIVGREVEGIEEEILDLCDKIIEIPMHGKKESFNVTIAAAIALYHLKA